MLNLPFTRPFTALSADLFQQLQYLPDLFFRRLKDGIRILTSSALQFLPGAGYGIAALVQQLLDLQDIVQVLLRVKPLA